MGGFKGCLEGIFGNPSLTKFEGKIKNIRTYEKKIIRKPEKHNFFP